MFQIYICILGRVNTRRRMIRENEVWNNAGEVALSRHKGGRRMEGRSLTVEGSKGMGLGFNHDFHSPAIHLVWDWKLTDRRGSECWWRGKSCMPVCVCLRCARVYMYLCSYVQLCVPLNFASVWKIRFQRHSRTAKLLLYLTFYVTHSTWKSL